MFFDNIDSNNDDILDVRETFSKLYFVFCMFKVLARFWTCLDQLEPIIKKLNQTSGQKNFKKQSERTFREVLLTR